MERALRKPFSAFSRHTLTGSWFSRSRDGTISTARITRDGRRTRSGARIRRARKGLKVLKTLGLYLREDVTSGPLVKIDDPRFDPMWEACAGFKMPVAIHISDPEAFFLPIDRFNERFEELNNHPDWSFYGHDFPSNRELLEARNRVLARHPQDRSLLPSMWETTPRTWPLSPSAWTVSRTCTWNSPRALANSAANPARRASSSRATRTASCSGPTPCQRNGHSPADPLRQTL